ncbi:hypothetical protein BAY60_00550 [Prauserella muralis]|uniref:Uncharacterized protein n=1 Tax=Prauserella muralis TaxID=588067 RepID=A0A2V4B6J4_9PSEU|nr:DUF2537 domain-containing protein [Prauserella muralis]PXY30958.1 hypothetical protein BAY60_00550 [Prauserella muralis]TWE14784.1 uncharacterized protein DUF2537 [Prauserella muralis]
MVEVELRVRDERAVLVGGQNGREADPRTLPLGPDLVDALHEWARVAAAVRRSGGTRGGEVVSRRGRQLAVRVATALDVPVSYHDPLTEDALVVTPPEPRTRVPAAGWLFGDEPEETGQDEPVPWGTGLLVSLFICVFVVVAMLALVSALAAETSAWIAVGAAVVVSAGLAPSLWLGRRVPIVRWIVLGAAAGVVLSWIGVLVIALG